ncbi:protein MMS22-like [Drosophila busckii]|uniref:protein MMS22-like n=1 Tax=Drosophila busckii TaxID=30019 RepID=UPI00083F28DF|nr:protein MMS22-like [Drosophila busckii]
MDYDLFQSDDDEDILTAFIQATQHPKLTPLLEPQLNAEEDADALGILPEFNCSGRDTLKQQTEFPTHGFVSNGYAQHPSLLPRSRLDILAFDFDVEQLRVSLVVNYLLGEACKNIQKLCAAVAGQKLLQQTLHGTGTGWYTARQQVTHVYHMLLHDVQLSEQWPQLSSAVGKLRQLLNSCLSSDLWRLLYYAEHSKGNECQAAAYQLFHGALEWRLLDLCLQRKHADNTTADCESQLGYQSQLERCLDELVLCASYLYQSKHSAELLYSSAFSCRCNKELWLILYHQAGADSNFWTLFHSTLQRHKTSAWNNNAAGYHEFYAWLTLNVARLASYNQTGVLQSKLQPLSAENFQTAPQLKQFLSCQPPPSEQQLRVYLCLLAPLQLHWSQPDTDVLCQLWEQLHRALNSSFSAAASQMEQLPMICASGAAYLERYQMLLGKPQLDDLNLSSFTIFALLLGKTLQLLPTLGRGNQSLKLLGRIFSKFSAAKLLALNEAGIHHLIELFLCLLLSHTEFNELASKLREMLLSLMLEKLTPARRLLTAKAHMALLLLHAQRRQPLDDYLNKLLAQLQALRQDAEVSACFVNVLEPIFEQADDFTRGEHLLLGPWLSSYLEHAPQVAQERVWQALHTLCQRLQKTNGADTGVMWQALQQHMLPQLRLQFVSSFSSWLPQLAADFVVLSKDKTLISLLLLDVQPVNTAASAQLLLQVLEQQQTSTSSNNNNCSAELIIHVWLKSLVLLPAQHASLLALTPHVLQLSELQQLQLDATELSTREPLCAFFGALGKRAQEPSLVGSARMQLSHKLHAYVAHFEQWLQPEQRAELQTRFYNFLAIVIYNCASLAYVRSKPSCFFHLAMSRFLLTTQLQAGMPPEPRQPQLLHKIFPVLLQGIARLPYQTDGYLSRTLEQLLLHWTPHFGFSSNFKLVARPFATLLQADAESPLVKHVLQLLAQQFLSVQRNQPGDHIFLMTALLQQLFVNLDDPQLQLAEQQLLTLLRAVHVPVLEHIMFVGELEASRVHLLKLHGVVLQLRVFKRCQAAQQLCAQDLRQLAQKHLAHCTYFYFQLLNKLAEQSSQLIKPLYAFIEQEALGVERKRGAGQDLGIRKSLKSLQQTLK